MLVIARVLSDIFKAGIGLVTGHKQPKPATHPATTPVSRIDRIVPPIEYDF